MLSRYNFYIIRARARSESFVYVDKNLILPHMYIYFRYLLNQRTMCLSRSILCFGLPLPAKPWFSFGNLINSTSFFIFFKAINNCSPSGMGHLLSCSEWMINNGVYILSTYVIGDFSLTRSQDSHGSIPKLTCHGTHVHPISLVP